MSAVQGINRFAAEIEGGERFPTETDCRDHARLVTDEGELAVLLSPERATVIGDLVSSSPGLLAPALVGRRDLSGNPPSSEQLAEKSVRAQKEWCCRYDDFVDAARYDLGVARSGQSR